MFLRKHEAGCDKRKKRKRLEQLTLSQKWSLDKFFVKILGQSSHLEELSENENENNDNESNIVDVNDLNEKHSIPSLDIYDPKSWDNLDNKTRDLLMENSPIKENIVNIPLDGNSWHFHILIILEYYQMRRIKIGNG